MGRGAFVVNRPEALPVQGQSFSLSDEEHTHLNDGGLPPRWYRFMPLKPPAVLSRTDPEASYNKFADLDPLEILSAGLKTLKPKRSLTAIGKGVGISAATMSRIRKGTSLLPPKLVGALASQDKDGDPVALALEIARAGSRAVSRERSVELSVPSPSFLPKHVDVERCSVLYRVQIETGLFRRDRDEEDEIVSVLRQGVDIALVFPNPDQLFPERRSDLDDPSELLREFGDSDIQDRFTRWTRRLKQAYPKDTEAIETRLRLHTVASTEDLIGFALGIAYTIAEVQDTEDGRVVFSGAVDYIGDPRPGRARLDSRIASALGRWCRRSVPWEGTG